MTDPALDLEAFKSGLPEGPWHADGLQVRFGSFCLAMCRTQTIACRAAGIDLEEKP